MLKAVIFSENSMKIIVVLRAKLSGECLVVTGVEDEVLSEPGMVIVEKLRGDVSSFVVNYCIERMLIADIVCGDSKEEVLVLLT